MKRYEKLTYQLIIIFAALAGVIIALWLFGFVCNLIGI